MAVRSGLFCIVAVAFIAASPALGQMPRSFKGWELYSWSEGGAWRFALLVGTNRIKFCDEIRNPKGTLTLEQAEDALRELASRDYVTWRGPEFFGPGRGCGLAFPPQQTVTRIRELGRQLDLNYSDDASEPPR